MVELIIKLHIMTDSTLVHFAEVEVLETIWIAQGCSYNEGVDFNDPSFQALPYWAVAVILELHETGAELASILLNV